MSLSKLFLGILIVLFVFKISSCSDQTNHQEKVDYFTIIVLEMNDMTIKINHFWKDLKKGLLKAKQNESQKLNLEQLDSLNLLFKQSFFSFDIKMKKLKNLTEVDNELNFKQNVINYLKETKQEQEKAILIYLNLLENGIENISEKQEEQLELFTQKCDELKQKSAEIDKLSMEFIEKYRISKKELKKKGLNNTEYYFN